MALTETSENGKAVTSHKASVFLDWVWGKAKSVLIVSLILAQAALNVFTLIDDEIHSRAYGAIESLAEYAALRTVARAISSRPILANSPTNKRKTAVTRATAKLAAENDALVGAKKGLVKEKDALAAANRELEAKHAHLQQNHADLETKHSALQKGNADLEAKHSALQKNHSELDAKHSEIQRATDSKKVAVKRVSKRISARALVSATRNVASMAAEAIPIVGSAVIVGVTVWDVVDACSNMRDQNEINILLGLETDDESKVCGMHVPTQAELNVQISQNWQAAYQAAADAVNQAGRTLVPIEPPSVSWPEVRDLISPIVDSVPKIFER